MRSTREDRFTKPRTMTAFWLWSLAVHGVLALVFTYARPSTPVVPERVEIDFTPTEELAPAPKTDRQRTRARKVEKQIVEQEHRLNDEIDKDTRFLSAFNQRVIQQTRAERSGKFNNVVRGGENAQGAKESSKPASAKATKTRAPGELPALADLLPKYDAPSAGAVGPKADVTGDPTRTDDYLKDIKPGLQTLISTREFVYYSYYNRIKEALRNHWEPEVRSRVKVIYRQGRGLASAQDRVTQVVVTLDARGELMKVDVLTQSGVQELDGAAVDAFRAAAPFPNPPKGMIEADGTVKIRWDFVLEV